VHALFGEQVPFVEHVHIPVLALAWVLLPALLFLLPLLRLALLSVPSPPSPWRPPPSW
jgi:hypothetical protein